MVRIGSVVRDREPLLTCVFHAAFGHHSLKNRHSPAAVNRLLETHIPTLFHAASTLSGSLCSPPSPHGEGGPRSGGQGTLANGALETIFPLFFIPLSSPNLRPFGAPPSIGRRECPREPLPLEGAAERSEAGLASLGGRRSGALVNCRLETIFPALFHTASTLSGSLRSPPSPRGEGFVRPYSFFHICVYSL